jgi:hypothetical protein
MRPYRRACIAGSTARPSRHRALDEEVQLGQVVGPARLGHRGFGLGAGGVQDQDINRAEAVSDCGDQPGNLVLAGDIGAEALGCPAIVADGVADGGDQFVAGSSVDCDGKAVTRQAPRDRRPQASRAARHQGGTCIVHCHVVMIPPPPSALGGRQHQARTKSPLIRALQLINGWRTTGHP